MENIKENYEYCKTLKLEQALKERDSCFNAEGAIINGAKLDALMQNQEFVKFLFSNENLVNNAQQEVDLPLKAAAEQFLNKEYPPSWYWKMPDYYYAGLYRTIYAVENSPWCLSSSEKSKLYFNLTRNEAVLNDCGWKRKEYNSCEYFNSDLPNIKLVFHKDSDLISFVSFNPDTQEELAHFDIPFSLVCGIFLKCREMDFKKPWQLRAHDYGDSFPNVFEQEHKIIRDPETKEIIDYGDWKPEEK